MIQDEKVEPLWDDDDEEDWEDWNDMPQEEWDKYDID